MCEVMIFEAIGKAVIGMAIAIVIFAAMIPIINFLFDYDGLAHRIYKWIKR